MRHLKWLGGLALMALLLSRPQAASRGAAQAMAHWYASVAPALFPFLALMPLLTSPEASEVYERLLGPAMGALFHLPGAAAPAMLVGMMGGAPAGVLAARQVAARGGMSRGQLHRMAAAFSGFSPAFLVVAVGTGLLGNVVLGWKLLAAQLLTQLTLALLLRRVWAGRTQRVPASAGGGDDPPVRGAVLTLLVICGYMALFGSLTAVAGEYLGRGASRALLCLLDVPSGVREVTGVHRPVVIAAMCGFGGMCVAAQNLGALKGCGIGAGEFVAVRALAGVLQGGYMALLTSGTLSGGQGLSRLAQANPLALGGLIASLMAAPVLLALKKSVS